MNDIRWVNPHQPQTLYIAVILCYVQAVFGLLLNRVGVSLLLLVLVALAVGGFGIANEKKWGYATAVGGAIAQVGLLVFYFGLTVLTNVSLLLNLAFDVALVALLVHPMSREYQRIWFR